MAGKSSEEHHSTTIIWGVDDPVATLKVSDFVWNIILKNRQTKAWYWKLPMVNHYLQNDQPEVINLIIRQALGEQVDFSRIDQGIRPVLVDRQRKQEVCK